MNFPKEHGDINVEMNCTNVYINKCRPLIVVCICTYKRNRLLEKLLEKLGNLRTDTLFDYKIVVVDNDASEGAKNVVNRQITQLDVPIIYDCEREQNIALTRNRAIRSAQGADYIAFIDDDELPERDWLVLLYTTLIKYQVHAVFAPVKPKFVCTPPTWVSKGKLLDRDTFPTGTPITNSVNTRTGNVLMCKTMFNEDTSFNPAYGRSGGEDVDFFRRKLLEGFLFVWCNEAAVYEEVPPERTTRKYLLNRALLRGVVAGRRSKAALMDVGKSCIAVMLYFVMLPVSLFIGHHHFMRILIRFCDHLGKLLTWIGLPPVKTRNF